MLFMVGSFNFAMAAGKGELYFDPSAREVKVGESFNLNIKVRPNGETIDTVRAIVNYPADLLEVSYFSLNGAFPTSAPGNIIDNQKGIVSQGGAIMGGVISADAQFGTITFLAKKDGVATISFGNQSKMIYSGQEKINITNLGSANIKIGANSVAAEPEDIIITSTSHADQNKWYNDVDAIFYWQLADKKQEVAAYYIDYSTNPEADPALKVEADQNSHIYNDIKDGIWYFSVKAQYKNNKYSKIARYKVMVDRTEPMKIQPIIEQPTAVAGDPIEMKFATIDQQSGIDYYEVGIDGENFTRQVSPYSIKDLAVGEHMVTVRAIDKAGNLIANAIPVNIVAPAPVEIVKTPTWKYIVIVLGFIFMVVVLIILKKKKN
jgi:hypothetical protein